MKKSVYAVCGSSLITIAALTRTFGDGGLELLTLLIVGVVLLIGSADLPESTKGKVR